MNQFEELLTVDELASRLKVPKSWIYERTRRRGKDQLPHFKLGKYVRFEWTAIGEFLGGQQFSLRRGPWEPK